MKLVKLWVLVLGLGWGLVCWGEQGAEVDPGEGYFQRGQFEDAVRTWEANYSSLSVGQLLGLATAYQQLGRLREALRVLQKTLNDKNIQSSGQAQVLMQLSELYLGMRVVDRELLEVTKLPGVCSKSESLLSEGNRERDQADIFIEEAEKCLSDSAKNIEKSGLRLQANLFNSKGNLLVVKAERKKLEAKYKEALAVYHEGDGLSKEASSEVLAQKEKAKQEAEKALKAYDKILTEAYEKALTEAYGKGEQLANDAGDKLLAAKIAVNIVQVLTEQQKCELAETKFHEILPQLIDLPDSHDKVFTLIGLAAQFTPMFTSLLQSFEDRQKPRCRFSKEDKRYFVLDQARKVAERLVKVDKGEKTAGKKTAMAYVEGYLAQLYIEQKRYEEAQQLTRQAIFHTQESADSGDLLSAPAPLFRWEWQLGKLFDLQQKGKDAIVVYRQAAKHLEITKQRCGGVSRAFLKEGEDFYYEYAELLHRQSRLVANNGYLEELTCVIDSFKTTQLQNYFYSGCPYDIIDNTRRLRGSDNRGIMTCFDEKSSTSTAATLSDPSVATTLSYPFVFANSVVKNITSLLGISHSIMPQFGSIGLSLGLRKQSGPGLLKTQLPPSEEPFKFDENFFRTNPSTAVLYLFMFDRNPNYKDVALELLTANSSKPICLLPSQNGDVCDDFNQMKTNVEELENKVNAFRTAICKPDAKGNCQLDKLSLSDLGAGKDLYQWLIAPFIPHLQGQGIDTLVLVPNSVLHTLPFAALQDEQGKYLIQKYALVVAPAGSQLTDFVTPPNYDNAALLAGLSRPVSLKEPERRDFPALQSQQEVDNIGIIYQNNEKLMDDSFTIDSLEGRLKDLKKSYSIVHLSTHGVFRGEVSNDAYLLTFDATIPPNNKVLSIDKFGQIVSATLKNERKVELLVLSACESAKGSENNGKPALGLAGMGISAGARSALGALWPVNDNATLALVKRFYERFRTDNKAKALQAAQIFILRGELTQDPTYKHPYYWAGFILTGNWF